MSRSKGKAVLAIPAEIFRAMLSHCLADAPRECCGLLGGVHPSVSLFYPLENLDPGQTTYNADPRDLIRADQDLRAREANILAIYHSHPSSPALPSLTDLRTNYYGPLPRIIVSLMGERPVVRMWKLEPTSSSELPWKVVP